MPQNNNQTDRRVITKVKQPHLYDVIFHNDDITTMDFVVSVLCDIFKKSIENATNLMLDIHIHGQAVVGTYSYDIAVSKAKKAMRIARENGFPLVVSLQQK